MAARKRSSVRGGRVRPGSIAWSTFLEAADRDGLARGTTAPLPHAPCWIFNGAGWTVEVWSRRRTVDPRPDQQGKHGTHGNGPKGIPCVRGFLVFVGVFSRASAWP